VTGASSSSTTVTSASVTAAAGDLYLTGVATRSNVAVSSVSGLGLAWTRVAAQCGGSGAQRVEVWMARGTPSANGAVRATFGASASQAVIAVSRYSGAHPTTPIGALRAQNTNGVNGACSGGASASSYDVPLATMGSGSVVYGAATIAQRTHTAGAGLIERAERHQGTGSGAGGLAVEDRTVASTGPTGVSGTLSGSTPWAAIGVEIRR
jgi:hypothetical protein